MSGGPSEAAAAHRSTPVGLAEDLSQRPLPDNGGEGPRRAARAVDLAAEGQLVGRGAPPSESGSGAAQIQRVGRLRRPLTAKKSDFERPRAAGRPCHDDRLREGDCVRDRLVSPQIRSGAGGRIGTRVEDLGIGGSGCQQQPDEQKMNPRTHGATRYSDIIMTRTGPHAVSRMFPMA